MSHRTAADIRAGIDHPIIDADGHWLEYRPTLIEALERIGGPIAAEGVRAVPQTGGPGCR